MSKPGTVEGRKSRVESRESKVEGRESKVESQESRVENGDTARMCATCICTLALSVLNPESWLRFSPTYRIRPTSYPLSFHQHSRIQRISPLFSYTCALPTGLFHHAPLFSITFPLRSCNKIPLFKHAGELTHPALSSRLGYVPWSCLS